MRTFTTSGVCAEEIRFEIDNHIITKVSFIGGCKGNLQGIAALVEGRPVAEVIEKLKGINCSGRDTSCPDQLAQALTEFIS